MTNVIKLASSNSAKPIRACSTCRHRKGRLCGATGFPITSERGHRVGSCDIDGNYWEPAPPKPPRVPGIFERGWRFLFGWRPDHADPS